MSRIIFMSTHRDLSKLVLDVAEETGIKVEVYEGWLEEAGRILEQLGGEEVDVVISRGGTARYLEKNCDIPVIYVDTSTFDIIECCYEARKYSSNIAITSFGKPYVGLPLIEKVMNISITEVIFETLAQLEERIRAFAEFGNHCIVGGGPAVSVAKKYRLPNVFLTTSKETIQDALVRAAELARLRREERYKACRLQAIINNIYDGIVAVDEEGKVDMINPSAERILRIKAADILGRDVRESVPNTRLDEVIKSGEAEIGDIQTVGDVQIFSNRIPIKDNQHCLGAVATFQEVSRVIQAEQQVRSKLTKNQFIARFSFADIIGESAAMIRTKKLANNFAKSDLTVLIYGQSGTGKEMFAQSIHNASNRSAQPFVAVNCGALPPSLLESELFGYDEGAFTGARKKGKQGLFEMAHGGTIFLDEIEALPIEMQGRFLRVLQEREVLRVGGDTIIPINIRVIAATNQFPTELLQEHKIRADLFYRLNVLYLEIIPLAERREDIPLLCEHFLPMGERKKIEGLLDEILPCLIRYSWPGNVRELSNIVQRLTFFADFFEPPRNASDILRVVSPQILNALEEQEDSEKETNLKGNLREVEDKLILKTLQEQGTIEKTALHLGVGRSTLCRKLKEIRSKSLTNEKGQSL